MRVLIVEGEPMISIGMESMLAELQHQTLATVRTVEDALEAVKLRPDVVLLDINLGGEMSYDVAHHSTLEAVPVVLTTGYALDDLPEGLQHCPVLVKPFTMEQMQSAIASASAARERDPH